MDKNAIDGKDIIALLQNMGLPVRINNFFTIVKKTYPNANINRQFVKDALQAGVHDGAIEMMNGFYVLKRESTFDQRNRLALGDTLVQTLDGTSKTTVQGSEQLYPLVLSESLVQTLEGTSQTAVQDSEQHYPLTLNEPLVETLEDTSQATVEDSMLDLAYSKAKKM